MLNELFAWNRRLMKAYLLKESLDRLWDYSYPGATMGDLQQWIDQLRWQRLQPMERLGRMLLNHYRGRGYRDMNYLVLKAQRLAFTKTEFIAFQKAA